LKDFYKDFFEREVYILYRSECQEEFLVGVKTPAHLFDLAHRLASRWRPPPTPRHDQLLVYSNTSEKAALPMTFEA